MGCAMHFRWPEDDDGREEDDGGHSERCSCKKVSPLWKKKPQGVVQGLGLTTAHHIFRVLTTSNLLWLFSMFQCFSSFEINGRCDSFLCFKILCFKFRDKRWRCTNLTGETIGGQEGQGCSYQGSRGTHVFQIFKG